MSFIKSIFDDDDYSDYTLWKKDFRGSTFLTDKNIVSSPLYKKGKVSKEIEKKYFTLTNNVLFYKAEHDD